MMYYIVTGAAGFIGSKLVEGLNRRGINEIIGCWRIAGSSAERMRCVNWRRISRSRKVVRS